MGLSRASCQIKKEGSEAKTKELLEGTKESSIPGRIIFQIAKIRIAFSAIPGVAPTRESHRSAVVLLTKQFNFTDFKHLHFPFFKSVIETGLLFWKKNFNLAFKKENARMFSKAVSKLFTAIITICCVHRLS